MVDSGPYSIVRYPFYSGVILSSLSVSFVYGNLCVTLTGLLVIVAILVIRFHYEEKTLRKELKGYVEYIGRVKYRLIPLIY